MQKRIHCINHSFIAALKEIICFFFCSFSSNSLNQFSAFILPQEVTHLLPFRHVWAVSIFYNHLALPKGSLVLRSAHIDRARPRFFICHFIFIILSGTGAWSRLERWEGRLQPIAVAGGRVPIPIASTHRCQRRRISRIMCAHSHDYMTRQIIVRVVPGRYNTTVFIYTLPRG